MAQILETTAVCDGLDLSVQWSDGSVGGVHLPVGVADAQAFVNKIEADRLAVNSAEALAAAKARKKEELSQFGIDVVTSHYPQDMQNVLLMMLTGAMAQGLVHRVQYLGQFLAWSGSIQAAVYAAEDAVDAATTVDAVQAVVLDANILESGDPHITARVAFGI